MPDLPESFAFSPRLAPAGTEKHGSNFLGAPAVFLPPLAYLLCLLPDWPEHRVLELAPLNWKQTAAREETQRVLNNNVYRSITLLEGL